MKRCGNASVQSYETTPYDRGKNVRMRAQGKRIIYADTNGEGQTHKGRVIFLLGTVAVSRTQTSQKCECLVRIPFTKTPLTDLPNPSSVKQPAKRPTCAVLKLTPHTAVVGSTFPGVLSQKQILQPSATSRNPPACHHQRMLHVPGGRAVLGFAFSALRSFNYTTR